MPISDISDLHYIVEINIREKKKEEQRTTIREIVN